MFFILSKLLSFLTNPVTWIFTLLLLALIHKKFHKKYLLAATITFFLFTNEFLFSECMRLWEIKPNPTVVRDNKTETAIVLGGYANFDKAYDLIGFHESTDRLMAAIELYQLGEISSLYLSGGSGSLRDTLFKESVFIREFLLKIGLPDSVIIIDSVSKNTHQNAVEAAKILNELFPNQKFLLISSGYHMRRAQACFEKAGLAVLPYSVDRVAGPRKFGMSHLFLPNANTLANWNLLIHEWLGFLSYKMMGYL